MRHSTKKSDSSLRIALVFFMSILLLIAGGFLLKLFLVLRASTFDGVHQYILEVDESKTKGALIAFNPSMNTVTVLHVAGKVDSTFGKYLDVPVDGFAEMSAFPATPSELIARLLLHARDEKGITIIDKLRLLLFVNGLKNSDFKESSLQLPVDSSTTEKLLPSLFLDNTLYSDNESISVINATGEPGLASKIAHELSVIGMNVVSVTTSSKEQDKTSISALRTNTYTVARIEHLFHISATTLNKQGISDITITIGKDSLAELE